MEYRYENQKAITRQDNLRRHSIRSSSDREHDRPNLHTYMGYRMDNLHCNTSGDIKSAYTADADCEHLETCKRYCGEE